MTMTAALLGGVGVVTVVGRGLVSMAVIQTWRTTICQSNFTNEVPPEITAAKPHAR